MLETVPHLPQLLDAKFSGRALAGLTKLKGDASTRSYYRAELAPSTTAPATLIVMRLPDEPPDGASRVQAQAFVDVQRFFAESQLPVPQIYAEDIAQGLMLLEDLGDDTFEARLRRTPLEQWPELYGAAIDLLARMHDAAARASDPSACIALRKRFDAALLRWELDHFREWGLEALFGALPAHDRTLLDTHFDALIASIMRLPQGFVHRDYQSRNLMWSRERLVIIDFQDAFIGPAPYDLVALLCDSYVSLSAEMQDAMLLRYAGQRDYTAAQLEGLVRGFRLIAVQRKLKDAGRFVFLDRVRYNPSFLPYYPGSLEYVARALGQLEELAPLRELLLRLVPQMPG
jgi:aminoglycoside/choline kinase family phosphotransferase